MTINKTISTTVLEQVKTSLIIALLVAISAFYMGVQFQKNSTIKVENSVIVQAEAKK